MFRLPRHARSRVPKRRPLALLLATAFAGAGSSSLATAADEIAAVTLGDTVVTANRYEAAIESVPATVTTVEGKTLERRLPADETDLFRDEPDVAMARDLRRFGATRVNLRGIEDNRVTQLVDGVRMPDWYNGGGPTNFTMSAPLGAAPGFLKRVEILRGPASSLYGSDAIGGVVGYFTLDPADLVAPGKTVGGRYRLGYSGENEGWSNTLLGAWRGETVEALLGYTRSDAHEFDNQGGRDVVAADRTAPNPQDVTDQGLLAKLVWRPAAGHRLALTLEGREQEADVEVLRLSASLPKVTAMSGEDRGRRVRTSFEWEHKPQSAFYDRLTTRLYHQDADTDNFNEQRRTNTTSTCAASARAGQVVGTDCRIEQDFSFNQTAIGGGAQFETGLRAWGQDHLLTYGLDLSRVETEELRDALVWNLRTGTVSKNLAGDTFPLRDFANGRTETVGAFVQDEIAFADGRLTLTPGLRYDWRKLEPEVDALAQRVLSANKREPVEQTDAAFSPKLAALWRLAPDWSVYGQVVRGFRAPNYDEVNGSFRNTAQRYGVAPNPDLKPETSTGFELGAKLHADRLRGQLSVYDNRYKNFIESGRLNCPSDPRCISDLAVTLMAENLSKVRIYGAEARASWDFAPGWKVDGALAWAHGTNESNNEPLNSVEPARLSVGLAHDAGFWGAEGRLRAAARKDRVSDWTGQNDPTPDPWFRTPGYAVADFYAWWRPAKGVQASFAVHNLFDKKYWLWSDIRQADARDPVGVDFYSQPGRSLSASLQVDF